MSDCTTMRRATASEPASSTKCLRLSRGKFRLIVAPQVLASLQQQKNGAADDKAGTATDEELQQI